MNLAYSGTATDGTDFTGVASVTITGGNSSATFTLDTTDDLFAEGVESIVVDIDSIVDTDGSFEAVAEHSTNNQVTTTINDQTGSDGTPGAEDTALVSISGPSSVVEGETTTAYTVSIDNAVPAGNSVTVNLAYTGTATDGSDFTGVASVVITGGNTSTTFTLDTLDDFLADNAETIVIDIDSIVDTDGSFEAVAEHGTNNQVTTTINDQTGSDGTAGSEDTVYAVLSGPSSVNEGDTSTSYTVSLIDADGNAVSVDADTDVVIAFAEGTAEAGDYASTDRTVTILNGDSSVTFTVATNEDADFDDETFTASISSVEDTGQFEAIDTTTGANGQTPSQDTTIVDDDTIPVATDDTGSVDEDATLNVAAPGVLDNDSDADGDSLSVTAIRTGTEAGSGSSGTVGAALVGIYGTLTLNANGSYSYVADQAAADLLALGASATDTFTYTVSDGEGGTDTAELVITVNGLDDTPSLTPDTGSVTEDDAATLTTSGTLAAGTGGDAGEDKFTAETGLTGTGGYGTLDIDVDGNWTYSADNSQGAIQALSPSDSLTDQFTVTNADGVTTTTVTITINGNNDAPASADKNIAMAPDTSVVLGTADFGYSDIDGDPLDSVTIDSISLTNGGSLLYYNGSNWVSVTAGQSFSAADIDAGYLVFQPDAGETGSNYASFDFTVNDGTIDASTSNTITFDIGNVLTVSSPAPVDEGKSAVFVIEVSADRGVDTILDLTVGGDVDASDYSSTLYYMDGYTVEGYINWVAVSGGQVTIPNGDTSVAVRVTTTSDAVADNGEELSLNASIANDPNADSNADMSNTSASGSTTINDYPSLQVSAPSFVSEGDAAIFEVSLTGPKATDTLIDLAISGEATETNDYNATYEYSTDDGLTWTDVTGDQVTIPGSTAGIPGILVRVTTVTDASIEADETLRLTATTNEADPDLAGIANAGTAVSDSTVIVDVISLAVTEEVDGTVIGGTTTVIASSADYDYSVLSQPSHGTLTDNLDGTITYTADTDYSGSDSFIYVRTDAAGVSTYAKATVTVTAAADTPDISISISEPVADAPDPTNYIVNGSFETFTNPTTITGGVTVPVGSGDLTGWTTGANGNNALQLYNTNVTGITDTYAVDTTSGTNGKKHVELTQVVNDLTNGETYTLSFDVALPSGAGGGLTVTWNGATVSSLTTATTTMTTVTVNVVAGATNTLFISGEDGADDSGGGDGIGIYVDNVSLTAASAGSYTYSLNVDVAATDVDGSETLGDVTIELTGIPTGANPVMTAEDGTTYSPAETDTGSGDQTFTFTVPVDQLEGLTLTTNEPASADSFTVTASVTATEASNGSTATNSASTTANMPTTPANDVPTIGSSTLILANESGFVGTITETIDTKFSTDGTNSFSWNQTATTLPEIYVDGQLVSIAYDDVAGTITGTINGGGTEVFQLTINMQDGDATTVSYTQGSSLLGVLETTTGDIVLPGGGNDDIVIMEFGGAGSDLTAVVTAHNLIEDSLADIADADAEHTVNTNSVYIGVDSNNMNAGDQLVFDFVAEIADDGEGNSSTANDVYSLDIVLFNFGSEKSGDELFITVVSLDGSGSEVRENIVLLGDSNLVEQRYTVGSSNGYAIESIEFLAGNESSFKLGIEGISSVNYNTDFEFDAVYTITDDSDGDSDTGSVTVAMDGDEIIVYDSSRAEINAGDEANSRIDTLVFDSGDNIDFSALDNPTITNFEAFDLTNDADTGLAGAHSLSNLSAQDVLDITDTGNTLTIEGDSGDSLGLLTSDGWSAPTNDGTYDVYTSGSATIKVDPDVVVTIA